METVSESPQPDGSKPFFTREEARVVACLIEKQLTTPKYYPLTPKALTAACNQKSSREPVMNLSEGEVRHVANVLAQRGLVRVDSGDRTYRISHRIKHSFELTPAELAVLAVLLLRRPQTLNDILRRTSRMAESEDIHDVHRVVEKLITRDTPLAVLLPQGSGQREDRYTHTLCGEISAETYDIKPPVLPEADHSRLNKLEQRLDALETTLDELLRKIGE